MKKFKLEYGELSEGCREIYSEEVTAVDECRALLQFNLKHPDAVIARIKEIPFPGPDYRDAIMALFDRQREKGLDKYGMTLEENTTLTAAQRIEHAQEELVDALQYLEHLKMATMDQLTANDYQRAAMRTASGMHHDGYNGRGLLLNAVIGLNGEAGEVIDIVKKACFQGHELDRERMIEELGDVSWYLAVCCEALDVSLEEVMERNIDKLMARYPEGFDKARSINRTEKGGEG